MRLRLNDEYLIDCDEQSVQLIRERTITGDNARGRKPSADKIGQKREEGMGFYATIEQACLAFMQKSVQGIPEEAGGVQDVVGAIRDAEAHVIAAIRSAKWSKRQFAEV